MGKIKKEMRTEISIVKNEIAEIKKNQPKLITKIPELTNQSCKPLVSVEKLK